MDRRSPDSELETDRLPYTDEERSKGPRAAKSQGGPRSPYDLSCSRGDTPSLAANNNNNNNNDDSFENHNVNNNGNSHCHSGECDRVAESSRIRQRNLEFSAASAPESDSSRTQISPEGCNSFTLPHHTGHERLAHTDIGYESISCQRTGYERLPTQNFESMTDLESGRRRSSRLLEELSRRHCDSGVELGEDFSGSLDFSSNTSSPELVWDSGTSPFMDDDSSKLSSSNPEADNDFRYSSMSMNYEKEDNPAVLHFDITSCDTTKCCPFYLDHHSDQCPNSGSENSNFTRQSVDSPPNTPEYSKNNLELCSEQASGEHQSNDSTTFRLGSSFEGSQSGCCSSGKDRHSDYESCEDNCDQMCCSDSGSSCYSECGPDCNCSASPDHPNTLPQVKWTARLLGGNEQEVEAFKKKKMASMKK